MVASFQDRDTLSTHGVNQRTRITVAHHGDLHELPYEHLQRYLDECSLPDPRVIRYLMCDGRVTVRSLAVAKKEKVDRRLLRLRGKEDLRKNERVFRRGGYEVIAGVDEVGRGALAGPLVAAAVVMKKGTRITGEVRDSKMLTPERREELHGIIMAKAADISVVWIDPESIEQRGLQQVNIRALSDAVTGLSVRPDCVICDNFELEECEPPVFGLPEADNTFFSVALASVVAKVERDRMMINIHRRYPQYGFDHNKGYATPEHLRILQEIGPSEIHRMSFRGVMEPWEEGRLW